MKGVTSKQKMRIRESNIVTRAKDIKNRRNTQTSEEPVKYYDIFDISKARAKRRKEKAKKTQTDMEQNAQNAVNELNNQLNNNMGNQNNPDPPQNNPDPNGNQDNGHNDPPPFPLNEAAYNQMMTRVLNDMKGLFQQQQQALPVQQQSTPIQQQYQIAQPAQQGNAFPQVFSHQQAQPQQPFNPQAVGQVSLPQQPPAPQNPTQNPPPASASQQILQSIPAQNVTEKASTNFDPVQILSQVLKTISREFENGGKYDLAHMVLFLNSLLETKTLGFSPSATPALMTTFKKLREYIDNMEAKRLNELQTRNSSFEAQSSLNYFDVIANAWLRDIPKVSGDAQSGGRQPGPFRGGMQQNNFNKPQHYCMQYNNSGQCTYVNRATGRGCNYLHLCSNCGQQHPQKNCPNRSVQNSSGFQRGPMQQQHVQFQQPMQHMQQPSHQVGNFMGGQNLGQNSNPSAPGYSQTQSNLLRF